MRITIIQGACLPVPPLRGGAVERIWDRMGREFALAGHDVTHLSRAVPELPNEEVRNGVHHLRLRGFDQPANGIWLKILDLFYSRRAARLAPSADIVVTNTFWTPLMLKPANGAIYVDVQRMPKGQMRFYSRAARLRANSEAVREAILAEVPSARSRVTVIPNPLSEVPAESAHWETRPKRVLYAGRLHPEKGIGLLLQAWHRIRKIPRHADWELQLIGPVETAGGGGGRVWLDQLLTRYGDERVTITPPVFDSEILGKTYEQARLFVYPSVAAKGETFGLAVLEAMSHGTPPLVSSLACFADFVRPPANGFVFDHTQRNASELLATALDHALKSDLQSMAAQCAKVRASHSPEVIAAQFLEDFEKLKR